MAKTIKVKAKHPVQKPDMTWASEGEIFDIEEHRFSKRWMVKGDGRSKAAKTAEADAE